MFIFIFHITLMKTNYGSAVKHLNNFTISVMSVRKISIPQSRECMALLDVRVRTMTSCLPNYLSHPISSLSVKILLMWLTMGYTPLIGGVFELMHPRFEV